MNQYTAAIQRHGDHWIGWIEEIPGVNEQAATKHELLEDLRPSRQRSSFRRALEYVERQLEIEPLVRMFLKRIKRDPAGVPIKLYPFTRKTVSDDEPEPVEIDPRVAFSRPVLAGRGVPARKVCEHGRERAETFPAHLRFGRAAEPGASGSLRSLRG